MKTILNNNKNKQAVIDFLNDMGIENLYPAEHINISDIDEYTTFDDLTELLDDSSAFDVEMIYYSKAIEYLSENDPSLRESMEIASEYGYEAKDLNSELLASLLASRNTREEWSEKESEIETFLDSLIWEEDEDEN